MCVCFVFFCRPRMIPRSGFHRLAWILPFSPKLYSCACVGVSKKNKPALFFHISASVVAQTQMPVVGERGKNTKTQQQKTSQLSQSQPHFRAENCARRKKKKKKHTCGLKKNTLPPDAAEFQTTPPPPQHTHIFVCGCKSPPLPALPAAEAVVHIRPDRT